MDIRTAAIDLLGKLSKKHSAIIQGGCIGTSDKTQEIVIMFKEDTEKIPEGLPETHEGYPVKYFNGI